MGQYESRANRLVSDLGIVFPLKHLLSVVGQLDNYDSVWFWLIVRWSSSQQLFREIGDNAAFLSADREAEEQQQVVRLEQSRGATSA